MQSRVVRRVVQPDIFQVVIVRLAAVLDNSRKIFSRVKEKAVERAKATDEAVREHPYPAMAIALGVGALIGYVAAGRRSGT